MDRFQVFQCQDPECGTWMEVLVGCECGEACELSCCGKPMKMLVEQTADSTKEKHVPILTREAAGTKVVVGSVPHPMVDAHYIMAIELVDGDTVYRQFLKPGAAPEAFFAVQVSRSAYAREICNIHGLWKG